MERVELDLPFEKLDGTVHCVISRIKHRNKSETITCRGKLENGKKVKLDATLTPLPKPDSNGHEWHVDCLGMQTHAHTNGRVGDATYMFRFWLEVLTSRIRADKFVEVTVRIPKEGNCEQCPLYYDGAGQEYEERCQYLNTVILGAQKNDKCPAGQRNSG